MTCDELINFIEHRMSMSHIYQPLTIRALVDAGGSATVRQLAQTFLLHDESQVRYYEKRLKEMPLRVLKKHAIVERDGDLVQLGVGKLSLEQQARVRMLCEQKLQAFIQKRGLSIWDYRLLEVDPVPDSVRYKVLKAANGRCELCGATKKQRPLQVDHILPRSRRGKNDQSNLQVLCDRCNRAKGNKDATDFRVEAALDFDPACPFCDAVRAGTFAEEHKSVVAIEDGYPVTEGHMLVITRRHTPDYFSMTGEERREADDLVRVLRARIIAADSTITGFNVGANCGATAGQTIPHAHIHLIPRREGDTPQPRGGVRGAVPEKMSYWPEDA